MNDEQIIIERGELLIDCKQGTLQDIHTSSAMSPPHFTSSSSGIQARSEPVGRIEYDLAAD
jgi:hypothetical protein